MPNTYAMVVVREKMKINNYKGFSVGYISDVLL